MLAYSHESSESDDTTALRKPLGHLRTMNEYENFDGDIGGTVDEWK
jgi:hypothetical protein